MTAFLKKLIPFTAIVKTIEEVVTKLASGAPQRIRDISDVTAIENDARQAAQEAIAKG